MPLMEHPKLTNLDDEREIMRLLKSCHCIDVEANERRAVRGALQYGPLNIDDDDRDFVEEACEELIDARFYLGAECIRLRRLMRTHAAQFQAQPEVAHRIEAHVNSLLSAIITIDATMRDITHTP